MIYKSKISFSTTIDKQVAQKFRAKCKQDGVNMSAILQAYMEKYNEGKVKIRFSKTENGFEYELVDVIKY